MGYSMEFFFSHYSLAYMERQESGLLLKYLKPADITAKLAIDYSKEMYYAFTAESHLL